MKKVFTPEQKANVAVAAIKGVQSTSQISSMFEVHPTQVGLWKKQALRGLSEVFSDKRRKVQDDHEALIAELYKTIGQRDMELAWLKKILNGLSLQDNRSFIEADHSSLSIARQTELLGISRSGSNFPHDPCHVARERLCRSGKSRSCQYNNKRCYPMIDSH